MFITVNHTEDFTGGTKCLRPGMTLMIRKDHNNPYDDEAIAVYSEKKVKYGYVANSVHSVCRGTHSAGYIYETFEEEAKCIVRFVSEEFAIAELCRDDEKQIMLIQ